MTTDPCHSSICLVVSCCPYSYKKMRDYYLYLIKLVKNKKRKELKKIISFSVNMRLNYIIDNHFNLQVKSECGWGIIINPYTEKVVDIITCN
jgi:hypothetical protein